jgi:hypothetical protein
LFKCALLRERDKLSQSQCMARFLSLRLSCHRNACYQTVINVRASPNSVTLNHKEVLKGASPSTMGKFYENQYFHSFSRENRRPRRHMERIGGLVSKALSEVISQPEPFLVPACPFSPLDGAFSFLVSRKLHLCANGWPPLGLSTRIQSYRVDYGWCFAALCSR